MFRTSAELPLTLNHFDLSSACHAIAFYKDASEHIPAVPAGIEHDASLQESGIKNDVDAKWRRWINKASFGGDGSSGDGSSEDGNGSGDGEVPWSCLGKYRKQF